MRKKPFQNTDLKFLPSFARMAGPKLSIQTMERSIRLLPTPIFLLSIQSCSRSPVTERQLLFDEMAQAKA